MQHKRPIRDFTANALRLIEQYPWPGNVRELENRIKRAVIMADGTELSPEDLDLNDTLAPPQPFNLREIRDLAEQRAIQRAMIITENNISRTADLLGVTRPTLYNLMKKHDLSC
jgi:two-component system NtrC family response regulator